MRIRTQLITLMRMRIRIPAYHLHADTDSDPAHHFNADTDPDPAYHFDADPGLDPTLQFNADSCGSGSTTLTLAIADPTISHLIPLQRVCQVYKDSPTTIL